MNKLLTVLLASVFMSTTTAAFAADATGGDVPPAHQQKKEVPNTTKNGDYLQDQPDNNSNANQGSGNKQSKPGNIEKSKRFQEKPAEGGTGVNPQNK
ncbi:MAG: hypothetical protein ACTS9Y_02650 [Methylophilus sp.]|uniref:hypothetical protein n=1 Tax=Methylophilus sp. TaxID=29541 RepID=UPI003FA0E945